MGYHRVSRGSPLHLILNAKLGIVAIEWTESIVETHHAVPANNAMIYSSFNHASLPGSEWRLIVGAPALSRSAECPWPCGLALRIPRTARLTRADLWGREKERERERERDRERERERERENKTHSSSSIHPSPHTCSDRHIACCHHSSCPYHSPCSSDGNSPKVFNDISWRLPIQSPSRHHPRVSHLTAPAHGSMLSPCTLHSHNQHNCTNYHESRSTTRMKCLYGELCGCRRHTLLSQCLLTSGGKETWRYFTLAHTSQPIHRQTNTRLRFYNLFIISMGRIAGGETCEWWCVCMCACEDSNRWREYKQLLMDARHKRIDCLCGAGRHLSCRMTARNQQRCLLYPYCDISSYILSL